MTEWECDQKSENYFSSLRLVAYADDLTLLALSPSALCLMPEKFGKDHSVRFNPDKTQLICFRKWGFPSSISVKITFAGKQLTSLQSVKHLGQLLTDDVRDILLMYCVTFNHTVFRFMVVQHGHPHFIHLYISYKFI